MFITVTAIINKRRGKSPWLIGGNGYQTSRGKVGSWGQGQAGREGKGRGAEGARVRGQGGKGRGGKGARARGQRGQGAALVSLHSVRSCQEGIYG